MVPRTRSLRSNPDLLEPTAAPFEQATHTTVVARAAARFKIPADCNFLCMHALARCAAISRQEPEALIQWHGVFPADTPRLDTGARPRTSPQGHPALMSCPILVQTKSKQTDGIPPDSEKRTPWKVPLCPCLTHTFRWIRLLDYLLVEALAASASQVTSMGMRHFPTAIGACDNSHNVMVANFYCEVTPSQFVVAVLPPFPLLRP